MKGYVLKKTSSKSPVYLKETQCLRKGIDTPVLGTTTRLNEATVFTDKNPMIIFRRARSGVEYLCRQFEQIPAQEIRTVKLLRVGPVVAAVDPIMEKHGPHDLCQCGHQRQHHYLYVSDCQFDERCGCVVFKLKNDCHIQDCEMAREDCDRCPNKPISEVQP